MSKLMLIDAAHPEETRVALVSNGQVDDFDFETAGKEQLRGNIYLAKITRVEPSLQAAFVEYGGNRHGFLAFSEIHPDYYQLPQEDREALLREAAELAEAEGDEVDLDEDDEDRDDDTDEAENDAGEDTDDEEADADADESDEATDETDETEADADGDDESEDDGDTADTSDDSEAVAESAAKPAAKRRPVRRSRRASPAKRYKIQEVIRRRQVLLVQVVKEERGNKGAALTTYLSLAGRYSVLMPNTPRGGGISRKIPNGPDRKRLKSVMGELDVPTGMGLIVRTAGAKRTKTEIKRDYDYLTSLWDSIREKTLSSMAPTLIHEEGGLVHRAMRDLYNKDIEAVRIEGEAAYREAKDLANMLMPTQAKKVQLWDDPKPLFVAEGVEDQLDSIFSPSVQMKSGGYLVINQTEALVAIDVNSGKSTKERNIEQTALRTNLEAAEEACRQMRLRDLAGLVVIDFIDMDENKNNRAVEKRLKDALRHDRARVQHGKLSQFGLMEISRQRRRAGVLQATSDPCPTCDGTGRVRSVPSAALQLLRALEARAAGGGLLAITVEAPTEVALYLLNNKRDAVSRLEESAGFAISIKSSDNVLNGDFTIHAEKDPDFKPVRSRKPREERSDDGDDSGESSGRGRRRRRGRGGARDDEARDTEDNTETDTDDADSGSAEADTPESRDENEDGEGKRKRRRRGRRGGRRRRKGGDDAETGAPAALEPVVESGNAEIPDAPKRTPKPDAVPEDGGAYLDGLSMTVAELVEDAEDMPEAQPKADDTASDAASEDKPRSRRRRRRRPSGDRPDRDATEAESSSADDTETPEPVEAKVEVEAEPEPKPEPVEVKSEPEPEPTPEPEATPEPTATETPAPAEDAKPKKRGWWSRRVG